MPSTPMTRHLGAKNRSVTGSSSPLRRMPSTPMTRHLGAKNRSVTGSSSPLRRSSVGPPDGVYKSTNPNNRSVTGSSSPLRRSSVGPPDGVYKSTNPNASPFVSRRGLDRRQITSSWIQMASTNQQIQMRRHSFHEEA
ncbi:hypothetical protein QE152_g6363 [Popillia japonica]|uniref:Uncharacterized protein n=1 Tax=Popillia japonica TaxID=7064 RepID=A0AAW1MKY6_POPJA